MRYSQIRKMDISNGVGVGVSLFVQGCHFHCKGCFNKETWDFSGGHEWTDEIKQQFYELAGKPYVKRISILGGEPLAHENVEDVKTIIADLKELFPDKKIWLYTGYRLEEISTYDQWQAVKMSDVLVEGRFEIEHQDLFNKEIVFAGSTNQRIVDVKRSMSAGEVVLFEH